MLRNRSIALVALLLVLGSANFGHANSVQLIANGSIGASGFQSVGSFDGTTLPVGETLLIDLNVSRQELSAGDSWFSVGINSPGFNGVTNGEFGALTRTKTDTAGSHQFFDTTAGNINNNNDTTDATSRVRLLITNNGFGSAADYAYHVDNDNDGSFDTGIAGQFNLGASPMDVSFSALGKTHDYTTNVGNAGMITNLFNTGVGADGLALGDGVDDPHYALIVDPSGLGDATVPNGFPIGPWLANDADSRWIGPDAATANGPGGNYTYRTVFDLPGNADLTMAQITGAWGTDNGGVDILLNGISVGTGQLSTGFGSLTNFNISSNFQHGMNTLDFVVENFPGTGPNPTGLRVDNIVGTFDIIPEPTTATLSLIGLAGLLARRRRTA